MSVTPYPSDGSVLPSGSSLMIMPVAFVLFYGLAWVGRWFRWGYAHSMWTS
jgi:hypothetical protein